MEMNTRFCTKCGAPLEPGARFCTHCQAPVETAQPRQQQAVCSNCGSLLEPGAAYCTYCQTPVGQRKSGQRTCPNCGSPLEPGAAYCTRCQTPVRQGQPERPSERQTCPNCGAPLEPGTRFCVRCGTSLSGSSGGKVTVRCPSCGEVMPAGTRFCTRCAAPLQTIRETPEGGSRKTLWLILGIAGGVLLLAGILLFVFKDAIFGGDTETVPAGTRQAVSADTEAPAETREQVQAQTEARPSTQSGGKTSTKVEPAPVQTQPPGLSAEEARIAAVNAYDCEAELLSEDADGYYFSCYSRGRVRHHLGTVCVTRSGDVYTVDGMSPSPVNGVDVDYASSLFSDSTSGASFSFAAVDLTTGDTVGTANRTTAFSSSVLIDVPIMYTVARYLENGWISLDDVVPANHDISTRGVSKGKLSLTVRETLEYMFRESSNGATNNMIDYLGKDSINSTCRDAGYGSVTVANYIGSTQDFTSNDNYVSAADLCGMLDEMYNGSTAIDAAFLESTMAMDRIDANANKGLGRDLGSSLIANFNGVKASKYNEIILASRGGHTYALVLLSNGDDLGRLQNGAAALGGFVNGVMGN